ncbi:MAG: N-formylglutamate amidohydrolase [Desulfatiglandaceae bacterium]
MTFPFVISVPHCSARVPESLRPLLALSEPEIGESIDVGTQEIFGALPAQHVLCAQWSRLVVDLNRDPAQQGRKGVIPEVDYFGRSVYRATALPDEGRLQDRLRKYYWPYHQRLKKWLDEPRIRGLLDCHSLNGVGPLEAPDAGMKRKDIVLSNNGDHQGECVLDHGKITCPAGVLKLMADIFMAAGFSVAVNFPYSGGFITTHYGLELVERDRFAIQVEINQALFTDREVKGIIPPKLAAVREKVFNCMEEIARTLFFASPSRHFLLS